MQANTSGSGNTALGAYALLSNKANVGSVAVGYQTMENADDRTSGRLTYNTAVGCQALRGSDTSANRAIQFGAWLSVAL